MRTFLAWLPIGIAITGVTLLIYSAVQQNYRSSLNDPQIQMVEDAVDALSHGAVPADIVPRDKSVDIRTSLSPFIAIYDDYMVPLESSGVLGGQPPKPPEGVFQYAREHGNNLPHNTWQPEQGVRIALVVERIPSGGFVAAGRNMRVVEDRIRQMTEMLGLGMVGLLAITYAAVALVMRPRKKE